MPSTYTLISSNVLSSSAASVTFSAIPATYTDLVLRVSARSTRSATFDFFEVRFNADSAANYGSTEMYGDGSTASSVRQSSQNFAYPEFMNGNTSTSDTFASTELYIPNYLVSANKPFSSLSVSETNSATGAYVDAYAGLWTNTAAITSISLKPGSTRSFVSGSSFYLYGIKNS